MAKLPKQETVKQLVDFDEKSLARARNRQKAEVLDPGSTKGSPRRCPARLCVKMKESIGISTCVAQTVRRSSPEPP
jgi:hypothetical protein